jgi:hypothetical protein
MDERRELRHERAEEDEREQGRQPEKCGGSGERGRETLSTGRRLEGRRVAPAPAGLGAWRPHGRPSIATAMITITPTFGA